ncbi:acyl-CoA thioesterase [Numidum massiliense]|uniref:acyl-CoA thioesterase n=1 Tax=Numidum massiliense TaxID=1522315 RepID=UPI00093CE340|nr:thioesterase family protein [Numidum massiliense]
MSEVSLTEVRVRYQETDQMGVVYHSNYFVWFEVGRTALIRERGSSYRELEEKGIVLPVIEANCQYKAPARFEDVIRIETSVGELTPAKVRFDYRVVRDDGKLLAVGHTLHMWVDQAMKPFNFKRKWPHIYALLAGEDPAEQQWRQR